MTSRSARKRNAKQSNRPSLKPGAASSRIPGTHPHPKKDPKPGQMSMDEKPKSHRRISPTRSTLRMSETPTETPTRKSPMPVVPVDLTDDDVPIHHENDPVVEIGDFEVPELILRDNPVPVQTRTETTIQPPAPDPNDRGREVIKPSSDGARWIGPLAMLGLGGLLFAMLWHPDEVTKTVEGLLPPLPTLTFGVNEKGDFDFDVELDLPETMDAEEAPPVPPVVAPGTKKVATLATIAGTEGSFLPPEPPVTAVEKKIAVANALDDLKQRTQGQGAKIQQAALDLIAGRTPPMETPEDIAIVREAMATFRKDKRADFSAEQELRARVKALTTP